MLFFFQFYFHLPAAEPVPLLVVAVSALALVLVLLVQLAAVFAQPVAQVVPVEQFWVAAVSVLLVVPASEQQQLQLVPAVQNSFH